MTDFQNIDGVAVLRRIFADGGRIRETAINDAMAEAAHSAAFILLARADAAQKRELERIMYRIQRVLAARRRAKGMD